MTEIPKAKGPVSKRRPPEIDLAAKEIAAKEIMTAEAMAEAMPSPMVGEATKVEAAPPISPELVMAPPDLEPASNPAVAPPPPMPAAPKRSGGLVAGGAAGAIFGTLAALLYPQLQPLLGGAAKSTDPANLERRIAAIEVAGTELAKLKAIGNDLVALQQQAIAQRDALAETNKAIAALKQGAASSGAPPDIGPLLSPLLGPFGERLNRLEQAGQAQESQIKGVTTGQATQLAAAMLAATQALGASFERGTPIGNELTALEAISAKSNLGKADPGRAEKLAALKIYATSGAPNARALGERFKALYPAMLASEAAPASNNLLDRISASASQLVKIRPIGEQAGQNLAGQDLVSTLSRVDTALQRGDFAQAMKEALNLPEKPAKVAQSWLAELKARQAAALALRGLENDALQLITTSSK